MTEMPTPRGKLTADRPLADLTWLRVGGPADWLFQPEDEADLAAFFRELDTAVPVFAMGVGSNLIVRDGGLDGVVIKLGRPFMDTTFDAEAGTATLGAAANDARVAIAAAEAGLDLTFLRTIPGSIGGAVRMNAGCYGSYLADHLVEAHAVTRQGEAITLTPADLNFGYRHSDIPEGAVITRAILNAERGAPAALAEKMAEQIARRDATQPTKERTAGSTFRNPAGFSSTGRADDTHEAKAWKVIDEAGMRGFRLGGAMMSEKHPNFLINTGGASAADLESLGEEVRKRVAAHSGHSLEWEVVRIGRPRT